jgi:hypothetical protein
MRRTIGIVLLPALALVALMAWMFASPIGSGADDDYHLMSTWCAEDWSGLCQEGSTDDTRVVPDELAWIECFARHPQVSAACQDVLFASEGVEVETKRGNWIRAYPPVYYAVMGIFAGPDIQISALLMRFVTIILFLGITIALYLLLPPGRRPTLLWAWLITTLPLGIFVLASNNPSSWAVIGVGSAWLALLGYFETTGPRRVALGALFAASTLMAAGSREDSAVYVGFAIFLVLLMKFARSRTYLMQAILPVAMGLVALVLLLSASGATPSGPRDVSGEGSALTGSNVFGSNESQLTGLALFAYNALNIPFLWSGVFGTFGLGWLDTSMPWVVPLAAIAVFVAVGFAGLGRKDQRTAFAVALTGVVLWVAPLAVLQAGGDSLLEQVQPRYLLPLIVLLGGLLVLVPSDRVLSFGRIQAYTIAAALAVVNFIALHMNIRRYVTGIDGAGPNLDAGAEWWWALPVGPTAVWIIGAVAYGALVFLLVPRLASGRELGVVPELRLPRVSSLAR